ncbi:MAG: SPOR domain-containing protein [Alphaproteobacteria bacterium]|nr:SPOR domain-containing protein [Alphaproteobacteria bacterium]
MARQNRDYDAQPGNDQDDGEENSRLRWLPAAVVVAAFSGFAVLAWHAYHYGVQTVEDGELMVVEADQSPIKEKPVDPGGLKFPNQDKTVFETFSGSAGNPPKVERVMPPPEEPMPKHADVGETTTWINEKLKDGNQPPPAPVQTDTDVAADPAAKPARVIDVPAAQVKIIKADDVVTHVKPSAGGQAASTSQESEATTPASAAEDTAKKTVLDAEKKEKAPFSPPSREVRLADSRPPAATIKQAVAEPKKKPASGGQRVQLGAYGSESEARNAWTRLEKKFPELKGKTVYVVKADLGAKGIFYRLRAGGFADAKAFCAGLSAKGQACMMVP